MKIEEYEISIKFVIASYDTNVVQEAMSRCYEAAYNKIDCIDRLLIDKNRERVSWTIIDKDYQMKAVYLYNDTLIAYEVDYTNMDVDYATVDVSGMDAEEVSVALGMCLDCVGVEI